MGDALHTHGGVTSALEARLADGGLLATQGPSLLDARTGVLHGQGSATLVTGTASTAPMQVAVAPHHWVTTRGSAQGPYRGALEATALVPIAAAPASGSRIDVVYVKQQDAQPGIPAPDATTAPLYGVVQGLESTGTPAKPALPVGAEELATVTVSAGATRTDGAGILITNTARPTVARGAPIPVRNTTERTALIGSSGERGYPGLHITRLDLGGVIQRWVSGTTWDSYVSQADFDTRHSDTGWQPFTPAPGWAMVDFAATVPSAYRVRNGLLHMRALLQRTGGNLPAADAGGNIGDTPIIAATTPLVGSRNRYFAGHVTLGFGVGGFRLNADGSIDVTSTTPNRVIATGNQLSFEYTGVA